MSPPLASAATAAGLREHLRDPVAHGPCAEYTDVLQVGTRTLAPSGMLGDITEVHVWTNRPVWPQAPKITARPAAKKAAAKKPAAKKSSKK